ncbi:unnamed protein product [Orchesella dallaii]|uniref:F-box domain-containing protein n=1 Tax=Orchesella dallaii TaxID=48710 RepID=A0ABP1RFU7_9HEXA
MEKACENGETKENSSEESEQIEEVKLESNVEESEQKPQTHVFDLLTEIWDYILPNLNATEFHTLINTCPAWRKMFESQRATRLLHLVLPILVNHSSVTKNSLLRWREVSKSSKAIIDNILEHFVSPPKYFESLSTLDTEWSTYVIDESQPLRAIIPRLRLRYNFYDAGRIQKFMAHLKTSTEDSEYSSPFVTKSLQILLVSLVPGNPNNFNEISLNMLNKFGHGVIDITLHAAGMNVPCFFSLLSQLPNVKRIGIIGRGGQWNEDMQQEIETWEQNLELDHLEFLDLEGFGDYRTEENPMSGFFPALLRRCGTQLKRLTCSASNIAALRPELVPNLRFLRVNTFDRSAFTTLSQLDSLKLEELQLRSRSREPSDLTLPEIFQAVSSFARDLPHLRLFIALRVNENEVLENSEVVVVPLLKLTKLSTSLRNVQASWFWTFVQLYCPQLKHLNLHDGTTYELNSHEITQGEIDSLKEGFQLSSQIQKVTISCGLNSRGQTPQRVVLERDVGQKRKRFERMAWL